jgi:hypothetical protein
LRRGQGLWGGCDVSSTLQQTSSISATTTCTAWAYCCTPNLLFWCQYYAFLKYHFEEDLNKSCKKI